MGSRPLGLGRTAASARIDCRLIDEQLPLRMNRSLNCIFFLLSAALAPALCEAAEPDRSAISAVIESFRTAILHRDKPRFLGLFVTPDLPWQSVKSDESLAQIRGDDARPSKLRFDPKNNPTSFINFVVSSKATSEETFSNVVIDGDDDVATVAFDYAFLADGQPINSGKECWLLVRSETGWKITTLAWSVRLAPTHRKE